MRVPARLAAVLASVAAVPAVIALPVITPPGPHPHPIVPTVHSVLLDASGETPVTTGRFRLVGASWQAGTLRSGMHVEIRSRDGGRWSAWTALEPSDMGPDPGSADDRAAHGTVASDPIWVGRGDAAQTRVVRADGRLAAARLHPHHLRLTLVDPGTSSADGQPDPGMPLGGSIATALTTQPSIYTRAQWGADESLRENQCPSGPDYNTTVKIGFVHHTDTPNDYSSSDVPGIIRSIYAYHVKSNGWCDIGYNFVIDRFGRIWEGRYGGITKAVLGAHTGGFNTDSFGAAAIGTYTSTTPPSELVSAFQRLFAWKLGLYHRDPTSTDVLTSAGGGTSKYAAGTKVRFNVISGHRDAGNTSCPGDALYARLPSMRTATRSLMGLITPGVADFTGDGRTDYAIYRPSNQKWWVRDRGATQYGIQGDLPVPADYNGDGTTDIAIFRPSNQKWWVFGNNGVPYGIAGDLPVPGDYNGDGKTDFAVYRESNKTWYIRGVGSFEWGVAGDIPVPGDYLGDIGTDLAMYRPSNGTWYIRPLDGTGWTTTPYGIANDKPVPGDYNGDGKTDIAVWRPATGDWWVNGLGRFANVGSDGDVPAPGAYNGESLTLPAVYQPGTGMWLVGKNPAVAYGIPGDEPLPLPWIIYATYQQPATMAASTAIRVPIGG